VEREQAESRPDLRRRRQRRAGMVAATVVAGLGGGRMQAPRWRCGLRGDCAQPSRRRTSCTGVGVELRSGAARWDGRHGCAAGRGGLLALPSRGRAVWTGFSGRKPCRLLLVVMTTEPEGVVLPVGGVILEPISSAWVSPCENPVHLLDEQRRRFWRRYLVEGVVGGDTSWPGGGRTAIGVAGRLGAGGELKGVAELMRRRPTSCWRPGVASCLSGGLLAADCGGWHCFAVVSAAWDSVGGRRLQHRQGGTT
jgi:hypothetical protein